MKAIGKITVAILFLTSGVVVAQTDADMREKVVFGLKAGVNYSNVWDDSSNDFTADGKAGIVGGAFVSIPIGKFIGIQPEVLFSQKGFQGSGTFLFTDYTYSTTTNYLDIPLLVSFKPLPYLSIVAGPQYSFLMSKTDRFTSSVYTAEQLEDYSNDNIRKNTLGFLVGFDVNVNHIVISPRAGWDFQSNNGDGTSSIPQYKNQWLQLTLGYRF